MRIPRTWIGRKVRAKWDVSTDEFHGATLVRIHANGEVDVEFDDGAWWDNAPAHVVER